MCLLHVIQSNIRDSSMCIVVCLSPGQTYKLYHGCSMHGIPVMWLPDACHLVDFWYFLLSLSIIRTDPSTIPRLIQAWHIYHKTSRSVQDDKLLLLPSCGGCGMLLCMYVCRLWKLECGVVNNSYISTTWVFP